MVSRLQTKEQLVFLIQWLQKLQEEWTFKVKLVRASKSDPCWYQKAVTLLGWGPATGRGHVTLVEEAKDLWVKWRWRFSELASLETSSSKINQLCLWFLEWDCILKRPLIIQQEELKDSWRTNPRQGPSGTLPTTLSLGPGGERPSILFVGNGC